MRRRRWFKNVRHRPMSNSEMTIHTAAMQSRQDTAATEIAIQAELLALNFALEGVGAERAGEALRSLSQELKQALESQAQAPPKLRLEH